MSQSPDPKMFASDYVASTIPLFNSYVKGQDFSLAMGILIQAYAKRRPIFICGNGGSAGTSQHMANDLIKGTRYQDAPRLKVISLCDNVSTITAYANDEGYHSIFVEQLKSLWEPDSVLIAISASGNSENVVKAAQFTLNEGGRVIALVGFEGGVLKPIASVAIHFQSRNYGSVEDCQLMFGHLASQYLRGHIARLHEDEER